MEQAEIKRLVLNQKNYFSNGNTLDPNLRKKYLKKLYQTIKEYIEEVYEGLKLDLGKSKSESYMCEIGLVLSEISYMIRHIKEWSKPIKCKTPIAQYISKSFMLPCPYGTVLVMSPWNYPFLLSMEPIVEAVAAGNTVVLKTSEYSPNTNKIVKKILDKVFPPEYVCTIFGGLEENTTLIHTEFDYVFFTGSKNVGKIVYQNQSVFLTPVTLELGGKSPCIIDKKCNLKLAAKRIVFGKFLNLGQTCVAPDYIFCHEDIHGEFIKEVIYQIKKQFGENPLENPNYGKIITKHHFERVMGLVDTNKVIYGGLYNVNTLQLEPTIMDNVEYGDRIMQEEIFGPIMPILTYKDINEVEKYVSRHDAPLAFYIFSKDKKLINYCLTNFSFGGGCVNDVVIHLATSYMPFGGFKESGLGSYHGKKGFDTFTHYKSIVDKKTIIDLPMRYQPYKKANDKLVKFFLK